jgi:hypothetical protein
MSQQTIDIGASPDDRTGDPLRTAFEKINGNFTELYEEGLRASGVLTGYTSPDVPAAPAFVILSWFGTTYANQDFSFSFTVNGTTTNFHASGTDPADGKIWIDSSSLNNVDLYKAAILSAIAANCDVAVDSAYFKVLTNNTGSSATIAASGDATLGYNVHSPGDDDVPPSGNVDEVELVAAVGGKKIGLITARLFGNLPSNVQLALKLGGVYTPASNTITPDGDPHDFAPDDNGGGSIASRYFAGNNNGESLVARITSAVGTQAGAACRIEVVAERL